MKKYFIASYFLLVLGVLASANIYAQQEVMMITTIEYMDFLDGSSSQMHITYPDGKSESLQLRGLYALAGYISDKKIKENDKTVVTKLNEFLQKGWRISVVSSSTQPKSPETSSPPSSIITRYVLVRG
ncbi:MAG: hypothetical protein NZ551_10075 [Microscillaceae bacterium]|nr:hypothetical protein [Microscillaceae bacterium]MDW8461543.1 hypothetical protein [Cytophagales bacterium]